MPVITKEALELLRKQTEMMPNREAAKVNWSGALLGFLLGEMLAGLTVNTTMAWLTVWAPFALPVVFIALPVVFAQIQYRHALRRSPLEAGLVGCLIADVGTMELNSAPNGECLPIPGM